MQDLVDPVERRRVVNARVVADRLGGLDNQVNVYRHRHVRLNPAELLAAIQRQRCLVRLAGVLRCADGVLARASQHYQPAAAGESLHLPACTKFLLGDRAYFGIVPNRLRQDDHSKLMRRANRHRNLIRTKISGACPAAQYGSDPAVGYSVSRGTTEGSRTGEDVMGHSWPRFVACTVVHSETEFKTCQLYPLRTTSITVAAV